MERVGLVGIRAVLVALALSVGILLMKSDPDLLLSANETISRLKTLMMRDPSVSEVSEKQPEEMTAPPPGLIMGKKSRSFSPAACQMSGQVRQPTMMGHWGPCNYQCLTMPLFTQSSLTRRLMAAAVILHLQNP